MRGKLGSSFFTAPNCRITPADAGKTSVCIICNIFAWDHPRGCGENLKVALCGPVQTGSPPRMRGKRDLGMSLNCRFGITPADAGKTIDFAAFNSGIADHPRGCGENYSFCRCCRYNVGSPPRMRGKLAVKRQLIRCVRITPADAGKTWDSSDLIPVY